MKATSFSLCALAAASGAASLIYQIVWMRRLALVFGSSTQATSTVLAAFLGGLAIGTVIWGRVADRRPSSALTVFAIIEIVTGLYGVASLWIFNGVEALYLSAYPLFFGNSQLFTGLQFILSSLAILGPVILMGGSLPLLARQMGAGRGRIVHDVGALYGWNTLGAALGAGATTYGLLPAFGLSAAIIVAAAANVLVGGTAFIIRARWRNLSSPDALVASTEPAPDGNSSGALNKVLILSGLALSGFAAITFEIVWARLLAMVIGSSVYAFGTLVVVILLGLGTGSALYGRKPRTAEGHQKAFALLECLIAFTAAVSMISLPRLPGLFVRYFPAFRDSFDLQIAAHFGLAATVALIPSLLLGATFPAAIGALAAPTTRLGRSLGIAYAANTIGTVFGAWLAGFIFIPVVGLHRALIFGVLAAVVAGVSVWWQAQGPRLHRLPALTPAIAALLVILAVPNWPREVFAAGVGFFAPRYGTEQTFQDVASQIRLLYYRDGIHATISVDQSGPDLFYRSNGKTDASTQPGDTANQLLLGHLPMLLHPAPRDVFILGLGTGMTAAAVARYPVQGIDIVELEPAGVEAARFFDDHTDKVLDDPRVELIIGDGRNRLLAVEKQYDVIISDPSDLWVAGIGSLATLEYYRTVRSRLRAGGVFAQWIHTHSLLPEDFDLLTATFRTVFPHTEVWTSAQGDLIFLGAGDSVTWDYDRLRSQFGQTAGVADDLKAIGIWHPYALFGAHVLGREETDELINEAALASLHTDDHPVLEFRTPRSLYVETAPMIVELLNDYRNSDPPMIAGFDSKRDLDAEATYLLGFAYASLGRPQLGITYMERSTAMAPNEPMFLVGMANQYRESGRTAEAESAYEKALTLDLNNLEALLSLGEIRLDTGQLEWTRVLADRALRLAPQSARAHALVGRLMEAER